MLMVNCFMHNSIDSSPYFGCKSSHELLSGKNGKILPFAQKFQQNTSILKLFRKMPLFQRKTRFCENRVT